MNCIIMKMYIKFCFQNNNILRAGFPIYFIYFIRSSMCLMKVIQSVNISSVLQYLASEHVCTCGKIQSFNW